MRISIRGKALLAGVCILAGSAGWAQQSQKPVAQSKVSADLAVTFATERSQVVPGQSSFWFKGGGADAAVNFWRGLGIAASLNIGANFWLLCLSHLRRWVVDDGERG